MKNQDQESDKIKVLCVEDEQDIRENIDGILKDEGFDVFTAANAKEAIDIFLQKKPDIVISDIMMPEVSGYDLLKIIRANKSIRNNNVPFIFLSALGQKENIMKGISLSANDYLVKPIDFDLLIAKIREKTKNASKINEAHEKNIFNLKNQFSGILPSELSQYVGAINQISSILRTEPYGQFPHRKYLDDINKIYINSVKLKAVVDSVLSGDVTDNLNVNEEVVSPAGLIEDFLASLNEKLRSKIIFDSSMVGGDVMNIKVDKSVLVESVRKILAASLKSGVNNSVEISIVSDPSEQIAFIFHIVGEAKESIFRDSINKPLIDKMLDDQGCIFDIIVKGSDLSSVLYVPTYRVVKGRVRL